MDDGGGPAAPRVLRKRVRYYKVVRGASLKSSERVLRGAGADADNATGATDVYIIRSGGQLNFGEMAVRPPPPPPPPSRLLYNAACK